MSEYQYYEFQAIDRPLTAEEMRDLRAVSTRATITATHFVNQYNWGDFKGDVATWMEEYFDAHLYLANWGTHDLVLRLPRRVLDLDTAKQYCCGEAAELRERYLDLLSRREAAAWNEVDTLIAAKQAEKYEQAVTLLRDLRELAVRDGRAAKTDARLRRLREENTRKPAFLERMKRAGLGEGGL